MKRSVLIIGGVSMFAWGISSALTACGGDDAATVAADNDGGGASSSDGSSSGAASSSGGSSGTPGDGGAAEGGDAGGGGDGGGVVSNPNKITCGAAECTSPQQICCRPTGGDAGCIASTDSCQGGALVCDEKADCPNQDVCCRSAQGDQGCEAASNCDGLGDAIICKTNAECSDGGACKEWTCLGNLKVRSCAMPFVGCQ